TRRRGHWWTASGKLWPKSWGSTRSDGGMFFVQREAAKADAIRTHSPTKAPPLFQQVRGSVRRDFSCDLGRCRRPGHAKPARNSLAAGVAKRSSIAGRVRSTGDQVATQRPASAPAQRELSIAVSA